MKMKSQTRLKNSGRLFSMILLEFFFSVVCVAFQNFPFVKVELNVPRVLNIFQMYCIVTATPGG